MLRAWLKILFAIGILGATVGARAEQEASTKAPPTAENPATPTSADPSAAPAAEAGTTTESNTETNSSDAQTTATASPAVAPTTAPAAAATTAEIPPPNVDPVTPDAQTEPSIEIPSAPASTPAASAAAAPAPSPPPATSPSVTPSAIRSAVPIEPTSPTLVTEEKKPEPAAPTVAIPPPPPAPPPPPVIPPPTLPAPVAIIPEWKHESEAGLTLLGGNSDSRTFTAKQETVYESGPDKVKSLGQYLYTTALGNEVARSWMFNLRYERSLAERLSVYFGSGIEGNRFAGREYRINADAGARYYILPGDKVDKYLAQETGLRYIYEYRTETSVPRFIETPSLRFYVEGAAPITDTLSFKMWFEALPDLMDYRRLLINTEASLKLLITRHLYLKVSFRANYVGLPVQANLARWDYVYTTALAIKY